MCIINGNSLDELKKILFLDIETDGLDTTKCNVKFIGCLDKANFFMFDSSEDSLLELKELLSKYDKILTFNGNNFDLPILERYGISVEYWKHIDLYEVFKKRAVLLRSGGFKSYSLNNIVKDVGIKDEKGKIDYEIFMKDEWTEKEMIEITYYLRKDLELTSKLWDFLLDKFNPLGEFLTERDTSNFKHITSSTGAYTYKAICAGLNIKEEYSDIEGNNPYVGGYVMVPKKAAAKGRVLYLDFASLYPMMYAHANLFSSKCKCCSDEEKWKGTKLFTVEGSYCSKKQGKIEHMIKDLYTKRKGYKKVKDKREFAIKIILNSLYGISAKPSFKYIYNETTAPDCTKLARQCIKYAAKSFEGAGYEVIYCDTDSLFVHLTETQDKNKAITFSEEISKFISNQFPFPWEEFNLKLEDTLVYLQFFKDKLGKLKKKHYLYINEDDKMTIKGLDIIKKNCTKLGELIFTKYLKPEIIKTKDCIFEKSYIDHLINTLVAEDNLILAKRFNIKKDEYISKTSIYSLIKEKYGSGEMFLIKNYKLGVGRGVKYCSLKEAKDLSFEDIDLEDTYRELNVFMDEPIIKKSKKKKKEKENNKEVQHELSNIF